MSQRLTLILTTAERTDLTQMAQHNPKPYLRRRARALLLIADGHSAYWVARQGLDKVVRADTVYAWLHRYEQERSPKGLRMHPGRGRKPACFPAGQSRRTDGAAQPGHAQSRSTGLHAQPLDAGLAAG